MGLKRSHTKVSIRGYYYILCLSIHYIHMSHTFESAYTRLKEIQKDLSSREISDIEKLFGLQKEAKELHDFLLERLHTISPENDAWTTA